MNVDMAVLASMQVKPKMGQPCNNCGWCCLTQVCPVGQDLTGSKVAPCNLLVTKGDKHYCSLATDSHLREVLDIGGGCDARTMMEQIEELI